MEQEQTLCLNDGWARGGEHLEPGWACLETSGETEVDSAIRVHVPEQRITSLRRYIILLQHETGRLTILTHRGTHAPGEWVCQGCPLQEQFCSITSPFILSAAPSVFHGGRASPCADLSLFMTSPLTFAAVSISPSRSDGLRASSRPSAAAGASNPPGQSRKEAPELGKGCG